MTFSKSAPSRTVSLTTSPWRTTSRESGSYVRSSKTSGPGSGVSVRRSSARIRASSSRNENGLTR